QLCSFDANQKRRAAASDKQGSRSGNHQSSANHSKLNAAVENVNYLAARSLDAVFKTPSRIPLRTRIPARLAGSSPALQQQACRPASSSNSSNLDRVAEATSECLITSAAA